MVKVSVVTGFYNRGKVLERTIDSILNQSFNDLELIVFDDASSDDTALRLEELSKSYNDPRFRYIIHKANQGFVKGLAEAVEASNGEYIAIQGSGDVSLPHRIEKQVEFLDENPAIGAVGGWLYNIQENDGVRSLFNPPSKILSFEDVLKTNPFTHGEVMFRRSLYDEIGGYRVAFQYAQDHDLWLRMSKRAPLTTLPEVVYHRYTMLDGVSFVPEKTIRQRMFSIVAERLATMSGREEGEMYQLLERKGPEALIPLEDPKVQEFVPKAAIRLCIFGAPTTALEMAQMYITRQPIRLFTIFLIRLYSSRLGTIFQTPIRGTLKRAGKVSKKLKTFMQYGVK